MILSVLTREQDKRYIEPATVAYLHLVRLWNVGQSRNDLVETPNSQDLVTQKSTARSKAFRPHRELEATIDAEAKTEEAQLHNAPCIGSMTTKSKVKECWSTHALAESNRISGTNPQSVPNAHSPASDSLQLSLRPVDAFTSGGRPANFLYML